MKGRAFRVTARLTFDITAGELQQSPAILFSSITCLPDVYTPTPRQPPQSSLLRRPSNASYTACCALFAESSTNAWRDSTKPSTHLTHTASHSTGLSAQRRLQSSCSALTTPARWCWGRLCLPPALLLAHLTTMRRWDACAWDAVREMMMMLMKARLTTTVPRDLRAAAAMHWRPLLVCSLYSCRP